MDKELITYLQRMETRMETRMEARFEQLREETVQGFTELRGEIRRVEDQATQGFDGVKEDIRLAHVSIEDLRGDVRQIAEGVITANELLERYKKEVSGEIAEVEIRHQLAYRSLKQAGE